jgi:hypothetical protein
VLHGEGGVHLNNEREQGERRGGRGRKEKKKTKRKKEGRRDQRGKRRGHRGRKHEHARNTQPKPCKNTPTREGTPPLIPNPSQVHHKQHCKGNDYHLFPEEEAEVEEKERKIQKGKKKEEETKEVRGKGTEKRTRAHNKHTNETL